MAKKERVRKEKKVKERVKTKKHNYYKVEGDNIKRERKSCPKCGGGVFMAQHKSRNACGKCGYTEHNVKPETKKEVQEVKQETAEKPKEEKTQ